MPGKEIIRIIKLSLSLVILIALVYKCQSKGYIDPVLAAPASISEYVTFYSYGMASKNAISRDNIGMLRSTCKEAAYLSALARALEPNRSKITVSGSPGKYSVTRRDTTKARGVSLYRCEYITRSECRCTYRIQSNRLPDIWTKPMPDKEGFIDDDTALFFTRARAGEYSGAYRRQASCVENARLEGVAKMAFYLAKTLGQSGSIEITGEAPYVRTGECESDDNWRSCSCPVMLYQNNMRSKFERLLE